MSIGGILKNAHNSKTYRFMVGTLADLLQYSCTEVCNMCLARKIYYTPKYFMDDTVMQKKVLPEVLGLCLRKFSLMFVFYQFNVID